MNECIRVLPSFSTSMLDNLMATGQPQSATSALRVLVCCSQTESRSTTVSLLRECNYQVILISIGWLQVTFSENISFCCISQVHATRSTREAIALLSKQSSAPAYDIVIKVVSVSESLSRAASRSHTVTHSHHRISMGLSILPLILMLADS